MAQTPVGRTGDLADQALANLINQFARPLDFLRELVQNSIDAGTPRIDVWLQRDGDVLEIHVDDHGDGMDEAILDNQLTRLFASTKEDDLTKIGKFGIGFASIFAIEPDAVLLHTGRHGESWELLFHPDRSFDKVRLHTPVEGTKITLYKRMDPEEMPGFVREARWVLGYWCEHSRIPITFTDRTGAEAAVVAPVDDVFAAFEDPRVSACTAESVNGPFALQAALCIEHTVDDIHVLLGYADEPSYGFYNGGLTLVNTRNPDVLGRWEDRFGHLCFKVRCDALEHTLTRDNVLRDDHWAAAMEAVEEAAKPLRQKLLDRVALAVRTGEGTGSWYRHLARECWASALHREDKGFAKRPIWRTVAGSIHSLAELEIQAEELDAVCMASGQAELDRTLMENGLLLLVDGPSTRELVRAVLPDTSFGPYRQNLEPVPAHTLFVLPQLLEPDQLTEVENRLLVALKRLFAAAIGWRLKAMLGDFGGSVLGRLEPLFVEGPADGRVFLRPSGRGFRLPARVRRRCLLVNRHHDYFQLQLSASLDDLPLAAFSLAQVLLSDEGQESEVTFGKLAEAALAGLV